MRGSMTKHVFFRILAPLPSATSFCFVPVVLASRQPATICQAFSVDAGLDLQTTMN